MGVIRELLRRLNPRPLPTLTAGPPPPIGSATSNAEDAGVPNIASTLNSEGSPTVDLRTAEVLSVDIDIDI